MYLLLTGESVSNGAVARNLAFAVENGVIAASGGAGEMKAAYAAAEIIDLRGLTALPGLIDIHVHGGSGHDTMDGTYEALNGMSLYKIEEGVTSFCPATVTASDEKTVAAIGAYNAAYEKGVDGAALAGLFLEGPYINPKNKGAHPEEYIRPVGLPEILALTAAVRHGVVSIALAPELPGAPDAITALTKRGVGVRVGHSSASLADADAAANAGANIAIHTYNAMSALNHREPGLVGAVFTNDGLYGEIICDLVHVHARAVEALYRCKGPDKTILITDCMRAGGLPDGEYYLGELPVKVTDGIARLFDGALAGSTATLISCVKKMCQNVGVPLKDVITMATATPAKALGLFDKIGSLDAGKQADFAAIDGDFNVRFVMRGGRIKKNCLSQ